MSEQIRKLHSLWNRSTGQTIPMGVCSFELEHGWCQFLKAGHTEQELLMVVSYLQAEIKKGERRSGAIKWRNCVGDLLNFEQELELARGALRRQPPVTPRERAVNNLRPSVTPVTPDGTRVTARPVSELIANLRRAAGMNP